MTDFTETTLPAAIKRLFELNHYEVDGPIQLHGAEIDLVATPKGDPFSAPVYIEATIQYVDNDKYGKDVGKLALIAELEPGARRVIVSSKGFSLPVKERARVTRIETLTYDELFKKFERFEPYISSCLEDSSVGNELRRLSEIYEEPDFSDIHGVEKATKYLTEWKDADQNPGKWLLITGEYGTGKTALTKVLQYRWLNQYQHNPDLALPLRIELREFASQFNARGLLHHFLDYNNLSHISIDFVLTLIRNGRAVLILNGYDEMAQYLHTRERRSCLEALAQLSAGGAKGIITSRPNYFTEAEELQMYEILYKSLAYGQYSMQPEAVALLEREEEIDNLLEQFIDRYERNLRDLSPEQTQQLINRVLVDDPDGREVVINLLNRIFRTTDEDTEISLSGKPVIVSYLLQVVEGLKEASENRQADSLTEWQIYKLIVDQLMIRDFKRSPEIAPHVRRNFLRKIAMYLSKKEHPVISENDFRDVVAVEFQREIKRLPADSQSDQVEKLFADLRSSATLTRGEQSTQYGWRFSHNTIREFLVAEALVEGLDGGRFVTEPVAVTDAMRIFASSMPKERRAELLRKLSRDWVTAEFFHGRGQLVALLWDGFVRLYPRAEGQRQLCMNQIMGTPPQMKEVRLTQIAISTEEDPVSMPGADFSKAFLSHVSFRAADLADANFEHTILEGVAFESCNLAKAKFGHAFVVEASFAGSNLDNADFSAIEEDDITIVVDAAKHSGKRALHGLNALGYLNARGATTKQLLPYYTLQHHGSFWVVDKIVRNLGKQTTRQRRGLEQRGAAHQDVKLAVDFVDHLEQRGLLVIPKGRKDLVKVTDQGRSVFSRYIGENHIARELIEFFDDKPFG